MSEHVLQQILASVARIEARFDAHSEHFDGKLDAQSARFDEKLDAQSARFDEKLDAQSARFDEKLDVLSARFDEKLDAQSARFDEKLDVLSARLDRLELGQANFRTELDKTRGAIMDRIDRLQNTINAMQDDILVNFGASEGVKRANENTRDELRNYFEMLTVTIRKVRTLESQMRDLTGGSA